MNLKYKGIDLEKIKQVQEIRFSHVDVAPDEVKFALEYISSDNNSLNMTAAQARLQDIIEAYQRKCEEDHDMFIICEMAKLFLEEKEKQKKVLERLEEELKLADEEKERCARENPLQFDSAKGYATAMYNAIEIVKRGGADMRKKVQDE